MSADGLTAGETLSTPDGQTKLARPRFRMAGALPLICDAGWCGRLGDLQRVAD